MCEGPACGRREHEEFEKPREASMAETQNAGQGREWSRQGGQVGQRPDLAEVRYRWWPGRVLCPEGTRKPAETFKQRGDMIRFVF